jgi:hypothetical protein
MSAPAPALDKPLLDDAPAMAANDAVLTRLEAVAEAFAAAGSYDDVAACAQIASRIAWMNHPGRFASARLERVLREGAATIPSVPYAGSGGGDPKRVLHVLTEAYETGGHTRLAWRWMLQDAARVHAVAMTRNRPVPSALLAAVEQRGGISVDVADPAATLLERAQRLRVLASTFDLVLLHVHPDDPVASLAFAGQTDRPPVAFVNHADHLFWLGREAADLVVNNRDVALRISRERRGIAPSRNTMLPLPLVGVAPRGGDREQARRELGIGPDQVLLLTIGSEYKFGPIGGAHFLDAAEPVVAEHPETVLLAVGPADQGRFADARRRTGGRVRALGGLRSVDHLYAAADVYLESYPCSSGTAVREAAAYGAPVVTFAPDPVEAEMVGSDASLASVWQRAETAADYMSLTSELIVDPAARARWGAAAAESVAQAQDGERWVEMVEEVYRQAMALGPLDPGELSEPSDELTGHDTIVHRIHAYTGQQIPLGQAEGETGRLEIIARSPTLRLAFSTLSGPHGTPEQRLRFAVALAAPVADAGVVTALVDEFRRLAGYGLVESFKMVVTPDLVDETVPLIEAALAAGPDVDVDLTVADDPRSAFQPGTLLVVADGDGFGPLPHDDYPLQHRAG